MEEGGQPARLARYEANAKELLSGMAKLGFSTYLSPDKQGCIISTFRESLAAPVCSVALALALTMASATLQLVAATIPAFSVVPDDPAWDFNAFYKGLEARGAVIYPGKLTDAECFRLGSIGVFLFCPS